MQKCGDKTLPNIYLVKLYPPLYMMPQIALVLQIVQ
jgi:hypothetical protein